jgi:glycogen debranching enzyme
VLRRAPQAGLADSTMLVARERIVGDGMRETVTLTNFGREASAVSINLYVEADFADLFAVKAGHTVHGGADATVTGTELVLRSRTDGGRGVSVTASADPLVLPGALSWRVVVPPHDRWSAEIVVQPAVGGRLVRPEATAPARKIRAWRSESTVITAGHWGLTKVLRRTESDLGALQVYDKERNVGPYVAAGAPWFMTLFGRDSLLTALMMLPLSPGLALGTLKNLARVQGTRTDPRTEEEPGRILHELRWGPASSQVLGGNHYYGTVDATPLFVVLLGECWRWGAREDDIRSLLPAADEALAWCETRGDRDGDGFVEYQRATDTGLVNQGWKDSFDGINDAEGTLAHPPIALCEVQGYVYAALLARAEMADDFGEPSVARDCRERAVRLRERFEEAFWLDDQGWYAVALDGHKCPVDALTSNIAHCLWTGIAQDSHAERIIGHLASDEMNSGYGLRTLSTSMGAYNPMSYHNGSVWPHDTAIAVAGLMRYAHLDGAVATASALASGILDGALAFGGRPPELYCGFSRSQFAPPVPYATSCSPQAWASASPLLLVRAMLGLSPDVPRRRLALSPHVPEAWGTVTLRDLRLGEATVRISAAGEQASVEGWPYDTSIQP